MSNVVKCTIRVTPGRDGLTSGRRSLTKEPRQIERTHYDGHGQGRIFGRGRKGSGPEGEAE